MALKNIRKPESKIEFLNDRGFSFVEMLTSLVMIVGVFALLSHFGSINSQRVRRVSGEACEQAARSTLDNLRAIGTEVAFFPTSLDASSNEFFRYSDPGLSSPAITPNQLFLDNRRVNQTQQLMVGNPEDGYERYNSHALVGSMTYLTNLFRQSGYCSMSPTAKGQHVAGISVQNQIPGQFTNVQTRIKIQGQNLTSGGKHCNTELYPIPANTSTAPSRSELGVAEPTNSQRDMGYWVTVTTDYRNEQNQERSCEVSGLFQYPRINSQLTSPSIRFVSRVAADTCAPRRRATATIEVSIGSNAITQGHVAMCRDFSLPGNFSTDPYTQCPTVSHESISGAAGRWVPCKEVTLCGRPVANTPSWNRNGVMSLRFTELPWGCRADIRVKVFDVTGEVAEDGTNFRAAETFAVSTCRDRCPVGGGRYCTSPNTRSRECRAPIFDTTDGSSGDGSSGGGSFSSGNGGSDGSSNDGGDDGGGETDGHDG